MTLPSYSILLDATDGSSASWAASLHAVALAQRLGAALLVVYVIDEALAFRSGIYFDSALHELAEEGESVTGAVVALAEDHGVRATPVVVRGRPGETIVRLAGERGVDLVVMGATGKSGVERTLLGSVSEHVVRQAGCLVAILRTPGPPQ